MTQIRKMEDEGPKRSPCTRKKSLTSFALPPSKVLAQASSKEPKARPLLTQAKA